ncbi:MAG: hypothetical protein ACRCU2_22695 [Planktothrix sp.]
MENQDRNLKDIEVLYTVQEAYEEMKEARDKIESILQKFKYKSNDSSEETHVFIKSLISSIDDWLDNIDKRRNRSTQKFEKNENPWPNL